jgi:hypothetical protein
MDLCNDCNIPAASMMMRAIQLLLAGAGLWFTFQIARRIRR